MFVGAKVIEQFALGMGIDILLTVFSPKGGPMSMSNAKLYSSSAGIGGISS